MPTCCSGGAATDREQLIRQCLSDVRARAWEIVRQAGRQAEVEELVAVGNLALVQAAGRWDPEGGASFRAYAYVRMRGAMLDYMRSHGALGRHDARRSSAIEACRFRFARREGRFPSDAELAAELGWTVRELSGREQRVLRAQPRSLDEPVLGPRSDEVSHLEELIPADADLEREVCANETAAELAALIRLLPRREQLVIRWGYWEGRTLREMAHWLGMTESGVWHIRRRALAQLRGLAPDLQEAA